MQGHAAANMVGCQKWVNDLPDPERPSDWNAILAGLSQFKRQFLGGRIPRLMQH